MLCSKLFHCSSCMFKVVVLLEGETHQKSSWFCSTIALYLQLSSHQLWPDSLSLLKISNSTAWCCCLHVSRWDSLLRLMCSLTFPWHIAFCLWPERLTRPNLTREHSSTCLLWSILGLLKTANGSSYDILWVMTFLLPLFHKGQIRVHN